MSLGWDTKYSLKTFLSTSLVKGRLKAFAIALVTSFSLYKEDTTSSLEIVGYPFFAKVFKTSLLPVAIFPNIATLTGAPFFFWHFGQ